jgi:hypothetical protein
MQKKGLMHVHALLHYGMSAAEGKIPKNVNFNSVQSIIFTDGEILDRRRRARKLLGQRRKEMRGRRRRKGGRKRRGARRSLVGGKRCGGKGKEGEGRKKERGAW